MMRLTPTLLAMWLAPPAVPCWLGGRETVGGTGSTKDACFLGGRCRAPPSMVAPSTEEQEEVDQTDMATSRGIIGSCPHCMGVGGRPEGLRTQV